MSDSDKPPDANCQAVAERKYAKLKRAVEAAGYFAWVRAEEDGDRIVCTSKHLGGNNYSGRIAFVTEVGGVWYLATPHPHHYRVRDPVRADQDVIAYLRQGHTSDLIPVAYEEYHHAIDRT